MSGTRSHGPPPAGPPSGRLGSLSQGNLSAPLGVRLWCRKRKRKGVRRPPGKAPLRTRALKSSEGQGQRCVCVTSSPDTRRTL